MFKKMKNEKFFFFFVKIKGKKTALIFLRLETKALPHHPFSISIRVYEERLEEGEEKEK